MLNRILTHTALPQRDREILKGIKTKGPRTYPMRKGENISEVLKARGISEAEVPRLPGRPCFYLDPRGLH